MRYLRRISRTKIQMSQIPPVISVRIASSRKLPKAYFFVFAIVAAYGPQAPLHHGSRVTIEFRKTGRSVEEATGKTRQLITIR